jgi:thiosulfate dehydrogenase
MIKQWIAFGFTALALVGWGAGTPNPLLGALKSANGMALYGERCAVCHGIRGRGDGPLGHKLAPPASDLTSESTQRKSDEELLKIIETGKSLTTMPSFEGQLSEQEIRDVVAYLRLLPQQPSPPNIQRPPADRSDISIHGATAAAFSLLPALPSLADVPPGEKGDAIRFGYELVVNTQQHAKDYVGNALNCRSCHLDAGRTPYAAPFVGVYAAYPIYRSRNAMMNTVERRINDCFERSMNGKPLPYDSKEMGALVTYMAWLSTGIPTGTIIPERGYPRIKPSRPPDQASGKTLFTAKCAVCHGLDGQGTAVAPPLWGPRSFNTGAGMAKLDTAAAFIKQNMPRDQGDTLTNDQAYDIAAYVLSHPRPVFSKGAADHPKGRKPSEPLF